MVMPRLPVRSLNLGRAAAGARGRLLCRALSYAIPLSQKFKDRRTTGGVVRRGESRMDAYAEIRALVLRSLDGMVAAGELPRGLSVEGVTVSPPRDESHGELATNAALAIARPARGRPRDIAENLAGRLRTDDRVVAADVAGAGFVNLTLAPDFWCGAVRAALSQGADYGRSNLGGGARVNLEFVSANPTGPLHIGHARGAVFGDALAALLSFCGYDVTREYYVNDAGAQVDTLARTVYLRYRESFGDEIELPDGAYPGDYLREVGAAAAGRYGDRFRSSDEAEWLEVLRCFAVVAMMDAIREDLDRLGVAMDLFVSERSLQQAGRIEEAVADLKEQDLIFTGALERPKGGASGDWTPRRQLLFRSSAFGDDTDRPLKKADGDWTYFASDLAYHADKIRRGFDVLIDVWGEDHGGYVPRMKAAVSALSRGRQELDVKLCRLVRLLEDGAPFKMSKREGAIVTVREVLDRVGRDVARFILLTRRNDAPLDFDVVKGLDQSRDNPVFYVHYAHARACSAMRRASEALEECDLSDAGLSGADLGALRQPAELALARRVAGWPSAVAASARAQEPHRVAFYLQSLAADLHGLWTAGRKDESLRFIREDDVEGTRARLALVRSAALVISVGLGILGIEPREEMR